MEIYWGLNNYFRQLDLQQRYFVYRTGLTLFRQGVQTVWRQPRRRGLRLGLLQEGQVVSRVQGERGLGTRGNTPDISTSDHFTAPTETFYWSEREQCRV